MVADEHILCIFLEPGLHRIASQAQNRLPREKVVHHNDVAEFAGRWARGAAPGLSYETPDTLRDRRNKPTTWSDGIYIRS